MALRIALVLAACGTMACSRSGFGGAVIDGRTIEMSRLPDGASSDSTGEGLDAIDSHIVDSVAGQDGSNSCSSRYGTILGFALCSAEPNSCTFAYDNVSANLISCTTHCASGGGTCLGSWDASGATPCTKQGAATCTGLHNTGICQCAH